MNLIFFFSSRRRHTRLTCDWSSDVCSSDLRTNRRRLWHHGSRSYEDAERNEIAQSRSRGGVECSDGGDCKRRSEEHTSELQSHVNLVCRLLLEKKKKKANMRAQSTPRQRLY